MEPVPVRGVFPVFDHVPELRETAAHMVEDTVQNDADPVLVKFPADLPEILVGPQADVDLFIVSCIITMRVRLKQRAEIDCVDPQFLHMRNPLRHFSDPVLCHFLFRILVIGKRSSAESQSINLIKHAVECPHIVYPPVVYPPESIPAVIVQSTGLFVSM